MDRSILHKLLLARRLLDLVRENTTGSNDTSLCIGVNFLQDAVEYFLLAVSEHINAGVTSGTSFEQYFDLINVKIAPKELPFRPRLVALNKLRVNSKHYGLIPSKSELDRLQVTVREFFDEVASSVVGIPFSSVSLIDLVRDGEEKELLQEAEAAFQDGNFEGCLVSCRKAIFVRFEASYDIAPYGSEGSKFGLGLLFWGNKAPYYAKNKKYIEENVHEPTDYIVLDHSNLDMDLMKSGIDTVSFWNAWRLTPAVYRPNPGADWVVKREFDKLFEDGIHDRAEYVLDTTINIFVTADQTLAATRTTQYGKHFVTLKHDQVPLYEKADEESRVIETTPVGLTQLFVMYEVPALNGNGHFYRVAHFEDVQLSGFISADTVTD